MKIYREENIKLLNDAIQGDEYEDVSQVLEGTGGQVGGIPSEAVDFIYMYLGNIKGFVLEMGVGSGAYYWNTFVSHVLEPAVSMVDLFKVRHVPGSNHYVRLGNISEDNVVHGVIECMPDNWKNMFEGALFTNGIFQVRSDYESFIEVNRILKIDGLFVFNIYTDDSKDIICGRVLGANNYVRVLKEFGFELVGRKDNCGTDGITYLCFKKVKDFDIRDLRKLQLIPVDKEKKIYKVNNLSPDRDWAFL